MEENINVKSSLELMQVNTVVLIYSVVKEMIAEYLQSGGAFQFWGKKG